MVAQLNQIAIAGDGNYLRSSGTTGLGTIVSPGSNVRGILVLASALSWGADNIRLMAKSTAPSAWNDSAAVTLAAGFGTGAGSAAGNTLLQRPIFLPAGLGLYEQASGSTNTTSCLVNYRIL